MATSLQEFKEILDAESLVDIIRLQEASRHGIPDFIRGTVWKYLLNVNSPNKDVEIALLENQSDEYLLIDKINHEIIKRLKGETQRFQQYRKNTFSTDVIITLQNVICAFINAHRQFEYSAALVYLCGPFCCCFKLESEIYYCLQTLISLHDLNSIAERSSTFLMLFRSLLPDLHRHFEEEEVDFKEFTTSWLSTLLAKELPIDCVLRLWDLYFSLNDGLNLHVYVCIAILNLHKETLEDLEQSEIRGLLMKLPLLDMDQVIMEAFRFKYEAEELDRFGCD